MYTGLYTTLAYRVVRVHRVIVLRVSKQLLCESSSKELIGEHEMPTGVVD